MALNEAKEANLREERTKGVLDFTSIPLQCEETPHVARAMGKRPSRPSSLCGLFPFRDKPKGLANYYPYHRRRCYLFKQCTIFRRLFNEKLKLARFYFKVEPPTSKNCLSQGIKIEERVI